MFRILLFCIVFAGVDLAAQELDVPKAYDLGVKAMESGKYDEGLAVVDEIIAKHGANGESAIRSGIRPFLLPERNASRSEEGVSQGDRKLQDLPREIHEPGKE